MKAQLRTFFAPAIVAGFMAGVSPWLQGAVATAGASVSGGNRVLVLDGQTAFMQVPDYLALHTISNSFTIEAWCLAKSFYPTKGSVNSVLRKNVAAESENFFLRIRNTDGQALIEFSLGSKVWLLRAPAELRTNAWFHLAGTYDGRTVSLYLNGTRLASEPVSGSLKIDASDLIVGRGDPEFSYGEYFQGMLDEIRIWNVARSSAEIQATLLKVLTGKEKGLVAYWNFDEGTAKDLCGKAKARLENGAQVKETARPSVVPPARSQTEPAAQENRAELTREKRLDVVEALWKSLNEIYPALEYKGIRGRKWIEPALRKAQEAASDHEFYGILLEQIATLKDTHTRILSYPGQPRLESPPVLLNRVQGKVTVVRAHENTGLAAGDVIVSIDGRPAELCLMDHFKFVCNSTELGRFREACGRLLRGSPGTTVTVDVERGNEMKRAVLRREAAPGFWREPAVAWRELEKTVGYIRIAHWGDSRIPEEFDRALEAFKQLPGLIIDVRGNGGGNDKLADVVNGRLIKEPVVSSIDFWRKAGTDQYSRTIGWVEPRGPWTFEGRVAVLIDEACASACEHFVSGIEAMGRVLLVGQPTNGAGGGPTSVNLPDGTQVAISRALGIRANGVVFEGHGIPPHVYAPLKLEDLRSGRDLAMEIAREWIASAKDVPSRIQPLPSWDAESL